MKRLPIIRHIRAMIFCYRCNRHYDIMRQSGFPLGGWSKGEIQHWEDIKEGRA
jgi:hypothetical protein